VLVIVTPGPLEASSGVIEFRSNRPNAAVAVLVDGRRVKLLGPTRRAGANVIVSIRVLAPTGATITISVGGETRSVEGVHLLGRDAFLARQVPKVDPAVTRMARAIAAANPTAGLSIECIGSSRLAEARQNRRVVAASTLKAAILALALTRSPRPETSPEWPTYEATIVNSSNEAANAVLTEIGGGSTTAGVNEVNALFLRIGMPSTRLDGPYRDTSGGPPSGKLTTARDLRTLMDGIYDAAATGTGPLARSGLGRHAARVLIGLMASADYPGLVRPFTSSPVAHKAGWLDAVENDAAIVFTPTGSCLVGITTDGLGYSSASAIGGRAVREVMLPLARHARAPARRAPASVRERRKKTSAASAPGSAPPTSPDAASTTERSASLFIVHRTAIGALAIALIVVALALARRARVLQRRQLRAARRAQRRPG
jgi:beta-lactamase class A